MRALVLAFLATAACGAPAPGAESCTTAPAPAPVELAASAAPAVAPAPAPKLPAIRVWLSPALYDPDGVRGGVGGWAMATAGVRDWTFVDATPEEVMAIPSPADVAIYSGTCGTADALGLRHGDGALMAPTPPANAAVWGCPDTATIDALETRLGVNGLTACAAP